VATEIERKYLVAGDGWRTEVVDGGTVIRQGYLARGETRTVRVRRAGGRAWITVKGPGTLARSEFEYEIPVDDADQLLSSLCEPGTIDKTRYRVHFGGRVWEVDEFHGRHSGLVLAEVELPATDAVVDVPPWVGAEVTTDPAYTNAELSRPGGPPAGSTR
jgi:adenylate cyclase